MLVKIHSLYNGNLHKAAIKIVPRTEFLRALPQQHKICTKYVEFRQTKSFRKKSDVNKKYSNETWMNAKVPKFFLLISHP